MSLDPTVVSPSRVNALLSCGVAFKMKYVDGLPEVRSGSAALRGSVMHKALETWGTDRSLALRPLTDQAWSEVTSGTSVYRFLDAYRKLSREAIAVEAEIRERRPEIVKVRATKDWKESDVARAIGKLLRVWKPRLIEHSPWQFTDNDPLPSLYDESLQWADLYQARSEHLPTVWHSEFGFDEPWRGFTLKGYIDTIEPLVSDEGELRGVGVIDYKSYKKAPAQLKDYRQCVMYYAALLQLLDRGVFTFPDGLPIYVGIDYLCWKPDWVDEHGKPFPARRFWGIGDADLDRLEAELRSYQAIVEGEHFLPAQKGFNPDYCPYPDNCCLSSTGAAGGCAELVTV